ncbi:MAG: recombinase RecJ [Thermoplasmata archaeon]|nr:MAG: recombinase RecJ [Thermoplasmata archaeon]
MLLKRAERIADIIKKSQHVHVVTHIDADGITAGSIACQTLERLGKNYSIDFVKQLDPGFLEKLKNDNHELVWFTDLGSNIDFEENKFSMVVTDHHICSKGTNYDFHMNPHLFNIDGSVEISGAGVTYLVSRAVDIKNMDLSALAVVGACGDLQDRKFSKLVGFNREYILRDSEKTGFVKPRVDITFFGRETRPIHKLLQYANDPVLPGLSGRETACINFLEELGIRMKDGDNWRRWIDLGKSERQRVISSILELLLTKGFGYKTIDKIIGEVYCLQKELEGTEVHEAKEYATLLNSTARYGQYEVGLKVCLGDRDKYLEKARNLLLGHRANIVEGLQFAKEEGIQRREYVQFFHAGTGIRDTIIGIITNMLLNSEEINSDLPIIGFAEKENGEIKVSARGTQMLVEKGLNLSAAVKKAASSLNGVGGGHNIAAGATIPKGKEEEFLDLVEDEIRNQLC